MSIDLYPVYNRGKKYLDIITKENNILLIFNIKITNCLLILL